MEFVGKYKHEKQEHLDDYFKAVGVPFLVRVMITKSNPDLEISKDGDEWTIVFKSLLRQTIKNFKLDEEYTEAMPNTTLKSITTLEEGKLSTSSVSTEGIKSRQTYLFEGEYLIMTLKHEETGVQAKRYFKKIQ